MDYVVKDSAASVVLCHESMQSVAAPIAKTNNATLCVLPPPSLDAALTDRFDIRPDRSAMIIYTSGTTGRPKGVVTTHKNIEAQVQMLVEAWGWSSNDHILQVLPLHHVHGIVAVLLSSLWSGATCEMQPGFHANEVWNRIMKKERVSLFMAVPTIYSTGRTDAVVAYFPSAKLIAHYKSLVRTPEQQREVREAFQRLRLMVSGSAALPQPVFEEWEKITGHRLLERYGMTELGLVISNPLKGERRPGFVGYPLRGVETRIVAGEPEHVVTPGESGELRIRGPSVFKEYWRRPDATKETFDKEGWFRTGDIAAVEDGMIRILGRASVDIIKTGGYKVSALDVERGLLAHPAIGEAAVVGLNDAEFGQKIAAIIVPKAGAPAPTLEALREWAKSEMAVYKIPKVLKVVKELPHNNMGKVNKKDLALTVFGEKL